MKRLQGLIALCTDFGVQDAYVGIMKGVMISINPEARFIDITHDVPAQDVFAGNWLLSNSYRYFPAGTIFLCIVDPGVGSERRPIILRAGNYTFVGPDNGLFTGILEQEPFEQAIHLTEPRFWRSEVSHTFQGRDIFSPVAAQLSLYQEPLSTFGRALSFEELVRFPLPKVEQTERRLLGQVVHIDIYGNLVTNIPLTLLPAEKRTLRAAIAGHQLQGFQHYYTQQAGSEQAFLYGDSAGSLAIAISCGNAARVLGVERHQEIEVLW